MVHSTKKKCKRCGARDHLPNIKISVAPGLVSVLPRACCNSDKRRNYHIYKYICVSPCNAGVKSVVAQQSVAGKKKRGPILGTIWQIS